MAEVSRVGVVGASEADLGLLDTIVIRSGGSPVSDTGVPSGAGTLEGLGALIVAGDGDRERSLIEAAMERDLPVLGVGLGMQAVNVAFGGAAPKEIAGHGIELKDGEPASAYHRIYIAPGSKLAAIVGSGGFVRVNSRHDGGLREAQKSPRLMASAYGLEDGVIEAVESPDHDWVIAVQFNPERRTEVPPHFDRLFQGLVERAAR